MFNFEDIKNCVKSKAEMYKELDGKMVKVITSSDNQITIVALHDVETNKIYMVDKILERSN